MDTKFNTSYFRDPAQRIAAELAYDIVTRRAGEHDNKLSIKDVNRVGELVDAELDALNKPNAKRSGPLAHLGAADLLELRRQFHTIRALLGVPVPHNGPSFCEVLSPGAIVDTRVRDCAVALGAAFGRPNNEVFLKDVLSVAANGLEGPRLPPDRQTDLDKRVYAAMDGGALPPDAVQTLAVFMRSGRGNLLSYGVVGVNGREFGEIFKLPFDAAKKGLSSTIEDYEKQFERCGYDRIYVRGSDGALYLTLNGHGAIDEVTLGARASLSVNRTSTITGEVVHVADVQNSLSEATLGFWKKSVTRLASLVRSAFSGRLERKIESVAASIASAPDPTQGDAAAAAKPSKINLQNTLVTGSVAASIGVASINLPIALSVLTGTAGVVTIANTLDYMLQKKTKAPIYSALGAVLGRPEESRGLE